MNHRLEARIEARPGEFTWAAQSELRDNEGATPKRKLTHIMFVCEICRKETSATPIASALGLAQSFDSHPCKPKSEWPPRAEPSPRGNPLDRAREREKLMREIEEEEERNPPRSF